MEQLNQIRLTLESYGFWPFAPRTLWQPKDSTSSEGSPCWDNSVEILRSSNGQSVQELWKNGTKLDQHWILMVLGHLRQEHCPKNRWNAKCSVPNTNYIVPNTKCTIQNTKYIIPCTRNIMMHSLFSWMIIAECWYTFMKAAVWPFPRVDGTGQGRILLNSDHLTQEPLSLKVKVKWKWYESEIKAN